MLLLFVIVFIDLVGFGVIIPLLPFYGEHYHASPQTVGLLMATYSLAQFIAAPVWGRLSDHHGRRPVLLISLAGLSASYLLLAYADTLALLFAARAVGGLMAGNLSAAFAYVADITTPQNRAKGMGMIGAAFGLGFIFGPAIGGLLAGSDPAQADFQTPSLLAAALSFVAFLVALFRLRESLSEEVRARLRSLPRRDRWLMFKEALARPGLGANLLLLFLSTFVFAGMEATFAMWSRRQFGWGPLQNGYLFACVGLFAAALQGGAVGRLVKRFGEARLVVHGSATLAAGLLLIPFSDGLALLAAAMILLTYGFSLLQPSLNSLISRATRQEDQGGVMGVSRSAATMARVLGPAWAGFLFGVLGREWPFLIGGALMLAVVAIAVAGVRRQPVQASNDT